MMAFALQVLLVLPAPSARLDLLEKLEPRDSQVRVDLQAELELLEPLGRLEDLDVQEILDL